MINRLPRIFLAVTAFLILITQNTYADDYHYLTQKLEAITQLSGTFKQTMRDDKNTKIDETKGQFKLLRPGYFLWETKPPQEQLIISNKEKLSVFDPDLDQVTVYDTQKVSQTPAGILTSDAAMIKDFFIVTKLKEKSKKIETFRLTYRDATAEDFTSFDITFKQSKLHRLLVLDKLNQTTEVIFTQLDDTTKINPSQFEFTPPEGVDVIIN